MTTTYNLLKKYNIRPKKGLGQNFLSDPNHLEKIVAAAQLTSTDTVLEIGPGLGALTVPLSQAARSVVAVDIDQTMLNILASEVQAPNLHLYHADILSIDPAQLLNTILPQFTLGQPYIVVANLPYYITSAIIRHLLEAPHPPQYTIITIQKEVAQRIVAKPGKMSLLAVSVQFYGKPELCHIIPATAFVPSPKIDSAVLRINRHQIPPVTTTNPSHYFRVVKAGFSQKRKQLKNSLTAALQKPPSQILNALNAAHIDPSRRAQTLSLIEWAALAEQIS